MIPYATKVRINPHCVAWCRTTRRDTKIMLRVIRPLMRGPSHLVGKCQRPSLRSGLQMLGQGSLLVAHAEVLCFQTGVLITVKTITVLCHNSSSSFTGLVTRNKRETIGLAEGPTIFGICQLSNVLFNMDQFNYNNLYLQVSSINNIAATTVIKI
jgi:hypothetical protein